MKVKIVAEIGLNHNGDLNIAKKLIDVCAVAGCDFVKFQKREVDLVYSPEELDKPRESPWGTTTREQKLGIEFGITDYQVIDAYCKEKGIGWFVSPWDEVSLELMYEEFWLPYIKVPSALMAEHDDFLRACATAAKLYDAKLILSTGMCDMDMIHHAIKCVSYFNVEYLLHCVSTYPGSLEDQQLACIPTLKEKYSWAKVGFSNHHPGIIPVVAAPLLGAEMVEFHVCLDRSMYGSDQSSSIEPPGIFRICDYIRSLEMAMGDGEKRILDSERSIITKLRG